jgi:hypothetical protein
VPEFVEDEAVPGRAEPGVRIGDIKTFDGFLVDVPPAVDIEAFTDRPGLVRDIRRVHQRCQIPLTQGG